MSSIVAVPVEESTAIIHACLRHGIRDFDTAPLYGQGESEQKLGVALLSATEETVGRPGGKSLGERRGVLGARQLTELAHWKHSTKG